MSSRSLITRQIPALFNGVSQQPQTLRTPSQAESQVNMHSTVVDGVRKRPGSQFVATVTTDDWDDAKIHAINRDTSSRYQVVVTDRDIQVFDVSDGSEKTVTFPGWPTRQNTTAYVVGDVVQLASPTTRLYRCTTAGTSAGSEGVFGTTLGGTTNDGTVVWEAIPNYLYSTNPAEDFVLVTVADYTFVVNRSVTTALRELPEAEPPNYDINYVPPIWRYGFDVTDFYNSLGDQALDGTVQAFSDLPGSPSTDDYYKVAGNDDDNFGGYYVRYDGDVWVETYGPSSNEAIDEATMPHVLVDQLDGTFDFVPFQWLPRRFGDQQTNPAPTFIGRALNEVFFYKNRLGLLSDENVVFSGAGDFGNFWRNTVTTVLDSDVVDVAVSTSKVSKLRYAVPFNNGLVLFADQTQFTLNVDQLLTPTSVSIDEVTSYEMDLGVEPVPINSEVYFVTSNGQNSRVREYYVADDTNNTEAADVTAHVPNYLPANLKQIAAAGNDDVLVALPATDGDEDHCLYIYKFHWRGDEKVQSAWYKWEFSSQNTILGVSIIENVIYLLMKRSDGVHLEKVDLDAGAVAGDLTHDLLLDHRTPIAPGDISWNVGTLRSTITLPYEVPVADRSEFYLIYEDRTDYEGVPVASPASQFVWTAADTVDVLNVNLESYNLFGGVNYDAEYEFSELFNADGNGVAITTGRLQLRTMTVYYKDANFFGTSVDPYGKNSPGEEDVHPQFLWSFSGKTLGDGGLYLNTPQFVEGAYRFTIGGNSRDVSIKLVNNFPYQAKFQSAEWEALYFNRSR